MQKVTLLLGIHCHQPVGNFDWVFEEGYQKSYLPFLEALERHPKIKMSLHYSGCLLEWLETNHPEFFDRLRALVKKGQIELMGGGFYEPILAIIPERDRIGQIRMLSSYIKDNFNFQPKGLWLAERVWEPSLPTTLKTAGMSYTVIDDYHFGDNKNRNGEVYDYYVTEEDGDTVNIFSSSRTLRYAIPFREPEETLNFLKKVSSEGGKCVTFADDGEKFGMWPGTYKWVYEEGWLERFFTALERNDSWISLSTFSEYIAGTAPKKLLYFPCASYEEMMEWSNGYFRNFMTKYSESDNMHKRMLNVSEKLDSFMTSKGPKARTSAVKENINKAKKLLYKSQCNCPYWHGVFGGLYLNHLRNAIFKNLIESDVMISSSMKETSASVEVKDYNKDGNNEVVISNNNFKLFVDPLKGASVCELDYLPAFTNLTNTLTRRYEKYHDKLAEIGAEAAVKHQPGAADGIPSIHDIAGVKAGALGNEICYDRYRRYSAIDHFFKTDVIPDDFTRCVFDDIGNFVEEPYAAEVVSGSGDVSVQFSRSGFLRRDGFQYPVTVNKNISLKEKSNDIEFTYEISNNGEREFSCRFGCEYNFSSMNDWLQNAGAAEPSGQFIIYDDWNGLKIEFDFEKPASLWHFPIETVSESEGGIEKTLQGTALMFWWVLRIPPQSKWKTDFKLRIQKKK